MERHHRRARNDTVSVPAETLAGVGAVIDGPAVVRLPAGLKACVATEADWGEVGAERDRYRKALQRLASGAWAREALDNHPAGIAPAVAIQDVRRIAREALGPAREETT